MLVFPLFVTTCQVSRVVVVGVIAAVTVCLYVTALTARNGRVLVDPTSMTSPETLYHRDDALLYIAYVMLIWAATIPADRWHCNLWP